MNIPCSFSTCMTCSFMATGDKEIQVQMFRWQTNRKIFATRLTRRTNCERPRRFSNANIALCPLMGSKLSTTQTARTRRYFACRKITLCDSTAKRSWSPSILLIYNFIINQENNFHLYIFSLTKVFSTVSLFCSLYYM